MMRAAAYAQPSTRAATTAAAAATAAGPPAALPTRRSKRREEREAAPGLANLAAPVQHTPTTQHNPYAASYPGDKTLTVLMIDSSSLHHTPQHVPESAPPAKANKTINKQPAKKNTNAKKLNANTNQSKAIHHAPASSKPANSPPRRRRSSGYQHVASRPVRRARTPSRWPAATSRTRWSCRLLPRLRRGGRQQRRRRSWTNSSGRSGRRGGGGASQLSAWRSSEQGRSVNGVLVLSTPASQHSATKRGLLSSRLWRRDFNLQCRSHAPGKRKRACAVAPLNRREGFSIHTTPPRLPAATSRPSARASS